jgi:flavin-dependent dehydrogenase
MIRTDVIIIGGGPAGAACAHRLKQDNIDCLILDSQSFPRNKVCAGWITPEVFIDLQCRPSDYPYGITTFTSFMVSFPHFTFNPRVLQYAVRRVEFDKWMLYRSGVPLKKHIVKKIVQKDGRYIIDDEYAGKFLIGAGGTQCPVYRTFFTKIYPRDKRLLIIAMEDEFPYEYKDDRCHLWFLDDELPGYAWYVPKADGMINIGLGAKAEKMKCAGVSIKKHWQDLLEKLLNNNLVTQHNFNPKGYSYYLRPKNPKVRIGNAMIVGDAAGLATRDMGEGIRSAIESGIAAAEAIILDKDYSVASLPKYSLFSLINPGKRN